MKGPKLKSSMAKRVFATVNPEILEWARTSAGFSLDSAAKSLKLDAEVLALWEQGGESPSIPQLRLLATLYKRPLAVFYLRGASPIPSPERPTPCASRRRPCVLTGSDAGDSCGTAAPILAQELTSDLGGQIEPFRFRLAAGSPDEAGEAIRRFLRLRVDTILQFGKDPTGRVAFNTWRGAIEDASVLVFQSSKIPQTEASGFALAYDETPVVVVNRKDAPQRRLFSLLHEFAHVALRESGVSDMRLDRDQAVQDADLEMRCNSIAAASLMPTEAVTAEYQAAVVDEGGLTDIAITRIARRFGVSRPALLLWLVRLGRASWDLYFEKDAQYKAEYEREQAAASRSLT